ncbi:hypothetical protein PGT21_016290 [Puccinia graminis f. sp. tritici]|uniref:Uncharacterized protein n=1 Tax=Puccinia graminis f. sp. tritici TaxID=56615 RepID=A0A5B0LXC4_PUCGR|nr:hypothetical protein PGTUg99_035913 [Puccinia graminis f. sp. tritici]KAA1104249.1 hypothetical protein PGT21_016290 [Puccinia graminis f. sp. tritici]
MSNQRVLGIHCLPKTLPALACQSQGFNGTKKLNGGQAIVAADPHIAREYALGLSFPRVLRYFTQSFQVGLSFPWVLPYFTQSFQAPESHQRQIQSRKVGFVPI